MVIAKAQHPLCHWPRQPVVFGGQSNSDPRPLSPLLTPGARLPRRNAHCIERLRKRNGTSCQEDTFKAELTSSGKAALPVQMSYSARPWMPGGFLGRRKSELPHPLISPGCGAGPVVPHGSPGHSPPTQSAGQQVPHQNSSSKQEIKPVTNFGKLCPSTSLQAALQVVGAETGQESSSTSIKF